MYHEVPHNSKLVLVRAACAALLLGNLILGRNILRDFFEIFGHITKTERRQMDRRLVIEVPSFLNSVEMGNNEKCPTMDRTLIVIRGSAI